MGAYQYTDPQTGQAYNFTIAGDAPSDTEFARIGQVIGEQRDQLADEYRSLFGREYVTDDGTAIGRGLRQGTAYAQGALGELVESAGQGLGIAGIENFGSGMEDSAQERQMELSLSEPSRVASYKDIGGVGDLLSYTGEQLGAALPVMGGMAAGAAGAYLTGVASPIIGAGAVGLPVFAGNNINETEAVKGEDQLTGADYRRAVGTAAFQSALDAIGLKGLARLGVGSGVLRDLEGQIGRRLLGRATTGAAAGVAVEAPTEFLQELGTLWQAGYDLDTPEVQDRLAEAIVAGGLIGGTIGGTGRGVFGKRPDGTPIVPDIEQTPEQEAQAAMEAQADAVLAEDVAAAPTTVEPTVEPTVAVAPTVEPTVAAVEPTVVTDDMLASLGARPTSTLRDPKKKSNIIGKTLSEVGKVLNKFAKNPEVVKKTPDVQARVDALLGGTDATGLGTGTTTGTTGVGSSAESSADGVGQLGGDVRGSARAGTPTAPDAAPVGSSLPASELDSGPTRGEPDTLAAPKEITPEAVADLTQEVDAIVTEPVPPVQAPQAAPQTAPQTKAEALQTKAEARAAAIRARTPEERAAAEEEFAENVRKRAAGTSVPVQAFGPLSAGSPMSADVLVPEGEIAQRAETLSQQPEPAPAPEPQTGTPGQQLGTAQQNIPAPVPPAPRAAPLQGASVPQADIQAVDDTRDVAAQDELNRRFEFARNTGVREFHDTQVDARSLPDVTTAVEKEGVIELLNTKDADLDATGKAAKLYFKRFRRPVDALDEMGMVSSAGPTQSVKKNYTPKEFAFYKGMTRKSAMDARKWVLDNMSPQAMAVTRDAAVLAKRDTSKFNPSDAYIGVTKTLKSIQQKEDNAFKSQLNRFLESPEMNSQAPADLDQSLRVEGATSGPVTGSFKPVKGQTAFDSYMLGMGFKKRKVPNKDEYTYSDPENGGKVLTPEEVQGYYDDLAYTQNELGFLLVDPVHGLDMALLPSIRNALQRGDLQFALNAIASTSQVDRVRQIAAKLAEVVGTTKVQVVDDLSQTVGRTAAGLYDPATNTISIDATNGMNVHTVLHEMTHAATSASLANPLLPEVKQLQAIFNTVREQMGEVYGTANLDEFVAEAFSNPEFQTALALTRVDGGKMSGWEKFTGAVRRIVRKLVGLKPKSPESALDEVDRIINGMLSPSPATRSAPSMMLLARTKAGAADLIRRNITAVPVAGKNYYEVVRDFTQANTPRALRQATLAVQPVNNLARLAQEKIPYANELNVLIDQQSGALRKAFEPVDKITSDWKAYKKANRAGYDRMQPLMNRATQDEVDPAMSRGTYDRYHMSYFNLATEKTIFKSFSTEPERAAAIKALNDDLKQKYGGQDKPRTTAKKAGDPSAKKAAIWDTLNKEYKTLGKEGQRLYKVTREMGQAAQDRIIPAIKARIDSLGVDQATQRTAFEKLAELMHAQGGVIRPYFKLSRGGDFRLAYSAPDPLRDDNGIELFAEYYHSEKDMMQAEQNVRKYLADIGQEALQGNIETGKRDSGRSYGDSPKSSFVFAVLQELNFAGEKLSPKERKAFEKTTDRIIDLSLDAIPERSFMQSFRSRKERSDGNRGILGALGDKTPSGMPGMDTDFANMFQDNFRGIEKQLVQLEYGAKIQKWRNRLKDDRYMERLDTADIAKKMDQIADFAQSPSIARWSQIATSLGFGFTMGANVSSALNIMFDMPMAVAPYLAGEYGTRKSTKALGVANRLFMGSPSTKMVTVMNENGVLETVEVKQRAHNKGYENYNYDDPTLAADIRRLKTLVEKAGARGMFNQSIDQEHVDLSETRDVITKISEVSGFLVHHGERYSRQITLVASYNLELDKLTGGKREPTQAEMDAAADKAMATAELTLGSTASAGRPVWAQGPVGNVAFLFKRFAVSRYYFMAHLVDQSLAGASPETRKIARYQLGYFMASTAALAGVGGMPLMGAASAIYNLFADDDEDDFEAMMTKTLGSTIYDGLANEILGIDIASRVSMNSLLYRPPFIDKDQPAIYTLFEQLGGPVVGQALNIDRGIKMLSDGEIRRGLEVMSPAVVRNISKAERFATEGANTLRGDPIVDDLNPYNAFMQAIGFAPAAYIENLGINSNERRKQNAVDTERRRLMRRHNMALAEGDNEARLQAREDILEFNNELPADFQDDRIDPAALARSYSGFETTTGKMVNGITYTDAMRRSREDYN